MWGFKKNKCALFQPKKYTTSEHTKKEVLPNLWIFHIWNGEPDWQKNKVNLSKVAEHPNDYLHDVPDSPTCHWTYHPIITTVHKNRAEESQ